MAISSFDKEFILDTEEAVDSFIGAITTPGKSVKIDRNSVTTEQEIQSEEKIKKMIYKR